jgi:hypothetical protein
MSYSVWPFTKEPEANGWNLGLGGGRSITPMELGPPKSQRRSSTVGKPTTLAFPDFTADELARFDRFYGEDTSRGSLPFWMPDPIYDGVSLLDETGTPLTDETGAAITINAWWLLLFGDMGQDGPSVTNPDADFFRVEFPVIILPA